MGGTLGSGRVCGVGFGCGTSWQCKGLVVGFCGTLGGGPVSSVVRFQVTRFFGLGVLCDVVCLPCGDDVVSMSGAVCSGWDLFVSLYEKMLRRVSS